MPRIADATCSRVGASNGSLAELSDLELLDGIRAASEPHFNELYERYFDRIYGFVHARVRNHADAEELVQETFVSVYRSIENYRGQSSLLSWIFGIAKNTVNNSIRRAINQRQKFESADAEDLAPQPTFSSGTPEEQLHLRRYTETIKQQFSALADWQRRIFEMRHMENMSIPEIAKRTHRSHDAIRSSLYRMKKMLLEGADLVGEREVG